MLLVEETVVKKSIVVIFFAENWKSFCTAKAPHFFGKQLQCFNVLYLWKFNIGIKHCFPHALPFARFLERHWKPRPTASVFNISLWTWQTFLYWKIMFGRFYCINSTKYSLKFGRNMELYLITVWPSTSECTFFNIRPLGPRASRDSRWLPSFDSTSMFRNGKTRWLLYNCRSAKWDTNSSTKTETGLPLYAIISMQNESNPFLCHPAVLGSRKFATCFLSHFSYSQFGIVKYENNIVLNSGVLIEYKDMMA